MDIVRTERLCQWEIPMTPSGMEPATFRLVAANIPRLLAYIPCVFMLCIFNKLYQYKLKPKNVDRILVISTFNLLSQIKIYSVPL
jgi:hypothetical protein